MSYSINTRDIPWVDSYARALEVWRTTKPWRGRTLETDARPLGKRNAKHKMVRKRGDGAIAFTLYNTDVVTYHPDGSAEIEPWAFVSTTAFAHRLLPDGVYPLFTNALGKLVEVHGDCYRIDSSVRLVRDEQTGGFLPSVATPTLPFDVYTLDRLKAREALKKHRYADFRAWLRSYDALSERRLPILNAEIVDYHKKVEMLDAGVERWSELISFRSVLDTLETVRRAIYKIEKCVSVEHPLTVNIARLRSVDEAERRWRRLV